MMRLTRRYRFSASHRLHCPALSAEANREVYGKCNYPHGHGHDYVLEVALRGRLDPETGRLADMGLLDRMVAREVKDAFDHRNLNTEVAAFAEAVPTTENLAAEIARRLEAAWKGTAQLDRVRLRETKRNSVELAL